MKRIKLRAWHIAEKKMCSVETLTDAGAFLVGVKKGEDDYGRKYFVRAPEHGRFCENDEFELMQFTGLLDKNGKQIFERDIVKTLCHVCTNRAEVGESKMDRDLFVLPEFKESENYCQIDWYSGVRVSGWRLLGKDKRFQTQLKWPTIMNMNIEVVGNIFETPELLT